jgi:DNA helicase-2/ATP-dependent DNA helicase PcrA
MPTAKSSDPLDEIKGLLLHGLTPDQITAVKTDRRRVLLIAGAGSGKTEVMARRVAWWVGVERVPRESIVAFTFTDKAAEEMKFRIRKHVQRITPEGQDATLGGMYVGTIHGFCLKTLREVAPDEYHNYDVIDEGARLALVQRVYHGLLALKPFEIAYGRGQYAAIDFFLRGYDLLNEYDLLDVQLPPGAIPHRVGEEWEWVKQAKLRTNVGKSDLAERFGVAAGRFYAYLRCRRFLDFSTSQSELTRLLQRDKDVINGLRSRVTRVVVDEVQDVNPVQDKLIRLITGDSGHLTAVGDHRQAIFAWRGGRVEIMAALYEELKKASDGKVIELAANFRSTERIIKLANGWARTIGRVRSMSSPDMTYGRVRRKDFDRTHTAAIAFSDHDEEAEWIAATIKKLVSKKSVESGAAHDTETGERGISYADVAVLLRSSNDARTYMTELERQGVPAVVRAGPDLFSQPEVLLMVGALGRLAGMDQFLGAAWGNSLPVRIAQVLGSSPVPADVIRAACARLRQRGLHLENDVEDRLLLATELGNKRIKGEPPATNAVLKRLRTPDLVAWLSKGGELRRIFPQTLFHYLLAEAGVARWDDGSDVGTTAMFHLGALSGLVKGLETPGWNRPDDFLYQIIALSMWGTKNARTEETPLLVPPDAVTVTTIHAAKGLEYAAVFVADVTSRRFPSQRAKQVDPVPFDGPILKTIDPQALADNNNTDHERRLLYVALTRAERYLFVTSPKPSGFFQTVSADLPPLGGIATTDRKFAPQKIRLLKSEYRQNLRLATSFSDLRYFLECPHDFYLRKVLGFAPSIDQAFGYGRGVHNLMRAIHSSPAEWAALASDPQMLKAKLEALISRGLFYLRYTTGDPLQRMQDHAAKIIADYVATYAPELAKLKFEPEREFETLIEEEQLLISGAIDVVRLDDPPRVSLIDFKSGESESDSAIKLSAEEMKLQVSLYGIAAKHELEYKPDQGIVRYLGEDDPKKKEMALLLDDKALAEARSKAISTAKEIKQRKFHEGPRRAPKNEKLASRCGECDFHLFCGHEAAAKHRASRRSG